MRFGLLVVVVAFSASVANADQLSKSWPQWLGPERTGHSGSVSGKWPPVKLWEKKFGSSDSSPIIVNGRLFLTTLDGNQTLVKCVDAKSGKVVWEGSTPGGRYGRHSVGDKEHYMGPLSSPACDGKIVFTLSIDGDLQAWSAATGKKGWGFNLYDRYKMGKRRHIRDYGYTSSPVLIGSNVVVEVGGNKGAVMSFDRKTGRENGSLGERAGGAQWWSGRTGGQGALRSRAALDSWEADRVAHRLCL